MKGVLAVLGVVVVGAAAYFMARGKKAPAAPAPRPAPTGSVGQQVQRQLASSLLTSANVAAFGGLLTSILPNGGAAKVAPTPGYGSGFVTERDLSTYTAPAAPAPAPVDNTFVVDLEDNNGGYSG